MFCRPIGPIELWGELLGRVTINQADLSDGRGILLESQRNSNACKAKRPIVSDRPVCKPLQILEDFCINNYTSRLMTIGGIFFSHGVFDAVALFSALGIVPLLHRADQITSDATNTLEGDALAKFFCGGFLLCHTVIAFIHGL